MKNVFKQILIFVLCAMMVACGDLLESEKTTAPIKGVTNADCDLKEAAEKIEKFLEEDVSQSVVCVQAHFEDFIRLVKSEKPGFLSRKDLVNFIKTRNLIDDPEQTLNYIEVLFKISKLIFGTDGDFISKQNLDDLVEFAKVLNIGMIKIYKHFKDEKNRTFSYHNVLKQDILRSTQNITSFLDKIILRKRGQIDRLNFIEVLDAFNFKNPDDKQKIIDFLFLKRAIIGGSEYELTHIELERVLDLNKISSLTTVIFDIAKLNKLTFKLDRNRYGLYKDDIRELICNFAYFDPLKFSGKDCISSNLNVYGNPLIFTMSELLNASKWFADDLGFNVHNHKDTINKIKDIYLNGPGDWFAQDFVKIVNLTDDIFDMGRFFADVYLHFESYLKSPKRISKDLSQYPLCEVLSKDFPTIFVRNSSGGLIVINDPAKECGAINNPQDPANQEQYELFKVQLADQVQLKDKYLDKFVRITKKYRFFRSTEWSMPFFNDGFKRSSSGAFEIGMFETIFDKFFTYFERTLPCDDPSIRKPCEQGEDNKKTLHLGQVMEIIEIFKEPLYELKIVLKNREDISAENTQLMSSLFQYQSDDNGLMDVNEATEFAVGIFSVAPLGNDIHNKIVEICRDEDESNVDEWNRIKVECFRKHFFSVFRSLSNNGDDPDAGKVEENFPKLFKKVDEMGTQEKTDFVLTIERFTRPCKGAKWEDIAISKEDMIGIMGGIYNVESTISRYDVNNNNVMDADEVDVAYDIYQGAVKGIIKEMEMADMFKSIAMGLHKQIFLYMIKNNEIPKVDAKFIKFLISFKWKAEADRTTIASILRNIALQSKTSLNSTFDCNTVRYPQSY